MIHLATDSTELLTVLRKELGLKRSRSIAPAEVFEQDDVRAYVVEHGGPRAVARFAYLVGRDDAIDATAVILAFSSATRQEPALIHALRRGSASYYPDLIVNPDLETLSVRVLPDDAQRSEGQADSLDEAQERFTAEGAGEPTVSLLLWWLIGAAESLLGPHQIIPVLVPRMRGKAADATLTALPQLIAGAREVCEQSGAGDALADRVHEAVSDLRETMHLTESQFQRLRQLVRAHAVRRRALPEEILASYRRAARSGTNDRQNSRERASALLHELQDAL
jgi:hypothetical protein